MELLKPFELMDELDIPSILIETANEAKITKRKHAAVLKQLIAGYLADAMQSQRIEAAQ